MEEIQASVIIVSFNTKHLLKRCFDSVKASAGKVTYEIIVVDNQSKDGSADYIRTEFPEVILIESQGNLGFGGANNLGFPRARGKYIVLLNTDAFFVDDAFAASVAEMDRNPQVGLAGLRLIGEEGESQPSARNFPTVLAEFRMFMGYDENSYPLTVPGKGPEDWLGEVPCDWVPGAFSIIRKPILDKLGFFDPAFFLYSEEVDLCLRIKKAGWQIVCWPRWSVIHLGGASTAVFNDKLVTKSGKQMGLWRLQSQYIFHRKHGGWLNAWGSKTVEILLNRVRIWKNKTKNPAKVEESRVMRDLIRRAWANTQGGKISPPRPWQGY